MPFGAYPIPNASAVSGDNPKALDRDVVETKEAAFEAAVAAASLALRQGHEVRVAAPGRGLASGSKP